MIIVQYENSRVYKCLKVNDDNPVFVKPRVVTFDVRSKYEEALKKLEKDDIIEKVDHSLKLGLASSPCGEA